MEVTVALQEILGVDKKNLHFTLCKDPQQPGKLLVYFGAALLEIVEDDGNIQAYKLLLARLYNSGLKVKAITDAFSVPYTTLRRWGDALKSGDAEKLVHVLAGRQHPRKLTTEILSFAHQRFNDIYPEDNDTYSKRIREEILEVFDISISGERLRPSFTQWKQSLRAMATAAEDEGKREVEDGKGKAVDGEAADTAGDKQLTAITDEPPAASGEVAILGMAEDAEQDENVRLPGQAASNTPSTQALANNNHKQRVDLSEAPAGYQFCHHAGILILSAFLNRLDAQLRDGSTLI